MAFPGVRFFGSPNAVFADYSNHPERPSQEEQVRIISRWWKLETEDNKKAYHLIFFLDPRMVLALQGGRFPADGMVMSAASKRPPHAHFTLLPG